MDRRTDDHTDVLKDIQIEIQIRERHIQEIDRYRDRQIQRKTDKEKYRCRERQIEKRTDRQKGGQMEKFVFN
jgi:hypothetical protein